jgi:cellulose biosynthesis protein BcsQ
MAPYKSFVFFNNRGGVGKTSLAFNFAVEMATRNPDHRVLVVDMDAQCNVSSLCLGGGIQGQNAVETIRAQQHSIRHFLATRALPAGARPNLTDPAFMINVRAFRQPTWVPADTGDLNDQVPANLFCVCGAIDLDIYASELETSASHHPTLENPTPFLSTYGRLRDAIEELPGEYIVVLDSNPSLSMATRMALVAARELIVPSTLDELTAGGLSNLIRQLAPGPPPNLAGVVFYSLHDLLRDRQNHERLAAARWGGANDYRLLRFAVIRTVVMNRYPRTPNLVLAAEGALDNMYDLLARAYLRHPQVLFATPHPGAMLPAIPAGPVGAAQLQAARQIIQRAYFQRVSDIGGTMQISINTVSALGLRRCSDLVTEWLSWVTGHRSHNVQSEAIYAPIRALLSG